MKYIFTYLLLVVTANAIAIDYDSPTANVMPKVANVAIMVLPMKYKLVLFGLKIPALL